jgi:NhaA family Na+:H+ antiporter
VNPGLLPSAQPSFLHSDRRLARAAQPIARFLHIEAAGGLLLIAATVVALVWANSPWAAGYDSIWHTEVRVAIGSYVFEETVGHLVNDLLMALFFFVVGMEIKRELVAGELRDPRAAALPAMAALGGMVVPAIVFAMFNAGGAGSNGWGIPMATDIAFALGVVALLGRRVPAPAKVLLLTLAIVDDIGAIAVIAVFYSDALDLGLLIVAAGIVGAVALLHRLEVTYPFVLLVAGLVFWLVVYESGVHATIAGVVMGLLTPAVPRQPALEADEIVNVLENRRDLQAAEVRATAAAVRGSVSACDRLIDVLHPWTSFVIVPLFALANAGIELTSDSLSDPSAVFGGVAVGLVVGKLAGITAFSWLAVKTGLGRLPRDTGWQHVIGLAALAGIGFTVSLFVTGLAFSDTDLQTDAKLGVLIASIAAAAIGAAVLARAATPAPAPWAADVPAVDG